MKIMINPKVSQKLTLNISLKTQPKSLS
jgi:hypothetical protein